MLGEDDNHVHPVIEIEEERERGGAARRREEVMMTVWKCSFAVFGIFPVVEAFMVHTELCIISACEE